MRVLVTGGRWYDNKKSVWHELNTLHQGCRITEIIHGAATGADTLAGEWAVEHEVREARYPAVWRPNGQFDRSAGIRRNIAMLAASTPTLVLAFPGGVGTAHMVRIARTGNYQVVEVEH